MNQLTLFRERSWDLRIPSSSVLDIGVWWTSKIVTIMSMRSTREIMEVMDGSGRLKAEKDRTGNICVCLVINVRVGKTISKNGDGSISASRARSVGVIRSVDVGSQSLERGLDVSRLAKDDGEFVIPRVTNLETVLDELGRAAEIHLQREIRVFYPGNGRTAETGPNDINKQPFETMGKVSI